MTRLSDDAVARLRRLTEEPDLSGTPYRIVREIGRGGMGVVYEAEEARLDRRVALKVVATALPAAAAGRLLDEARIVAGLEHPGIVPVFDAGELPGQRLFYAMKLVRGQRLDEWAAGGHSLAERLRVFVRVCEPVAFAHARGVVHRDLKPANVMAGELGSVLVMDWGVATAGRECGRTIAGTPGYMAPEQERGQTAGPASDVFALGRILSFLIGTGPLPRRLGAIVRKATAVDSATRYADARALADDVQAFLDGEPVRACRETVLDRFGRWLGRNRVLVALITAYLLMRVVVYFWLRL